MQGYIAVVTNIVAGTTGTLTIYAKRHLEHELSPGTTTVYSAPSWPYCHIRGVGSRICQRLTIVGIQDMIYIYAILSSYEHTRPSEYVAQLSVQYDNSRAGVKKEKKVTRTKKHSQRNNPQHHIIQPSTRAPKNIFFVKITDFFHW